MSRVPPPPPPPPPASSKAKNNKCVPTSDDDDIEFQANAFLVGQLSQTNSLGDGPTPLNYSSNNNSQTDSQAQRLQYVRSQIDDDHDGNKNVTDGNNNDTGLDGIDSTIMLPPKRSLSSHQGGSTVVPPKPPPRKGAAPSAQPPPPPPPSNTASTSGTQPLPTDYEEAQAQHRITLASVIGAKTASHRPKGIFKHSAISQLQRSLVGEEALGSFRLQTQQVSFADVSYPPSIASSCPSSPISSSVNQSIEESTASNPPAAAAVGNGADAEAREKLQSFFKKSSRLYVEEDQQQQQGPVLSKSAQILFSPTETPDTTITALVITPTQSEELEPAQSATTTTTPPTTTPTVANTEKSNLIIARHNQPVRKNDSSKIHFFIVVSFFP